MGHGMALGSCCQCGSGSEQISGERTCQGKALSCIGDWESGMSHQTGSLMRPLGVGMGLRYHQPAPGSASHRAVVPDPRPGCQGQGTLVLWFHLHSAGPCASGESPGLS